MKLSRRDMLTLMATAAVSAPNFAKVSSKVTKPISARAFKHGVASGDPDHHSIVLWTRITTNQPSAKVKWQLALDDDFKNVVQEGHVKTAQKRDYTVKVIPEKLVAGKRYFYRFYFNDEYSTTGRTITLPKGKQERLGIALVSCSNYPFGYFNAYDAIANDPTIDIVFHAGDYIYELAADNWGAKAGEAIQRLHQPAHEIVSLDDYRKRHAQYKTDQGTQNMHAMHPFVACWDDHESANNAWSQGAQNHQPETEGKWALRQQASLKAYYEWMPIREPLPNQNRVDYLRRYQFGDLATLTLLETRHAGRDEEQGPWAHQSLLQKPGGRDQFMKDILGDPSRQMMTEGMQRFAQQSIADSVEQKQPWRLVGSASPMARLLVPDIVKHGIADTDIPKASEYMKLFGKLNLPWYTDTWDGYAGARQAFYQSSQQVGANDLIVLSGDSHSFMANQLFDDNGVAMGLELSAAGVTSPSEFISSGWKPKAIKQLDAIFAQHTQEVNWFNSEYQGYTRIELSKNEGLATFVAVDTILSQQYKTIEFHQKRIVKSGDTLTFGV